ncbi:unnamed protein product [Adineta ricciae]|uniref:Reverse transcriptase domain-containing protein n=1 Tax=Adineta ricciae TaxID=249248 RepID=A0A816BUB3_ADIRI|nr:unnamed protein product [Adineta ricciae]
MVDGVQLSTTFFKAVLLSKFLFNLLPLSSTNVYGYLWRHYGNYTKTLFGELMKTRIEICKLNLAVLYIRTCRNENLVPTFVQFRVAIPRLANSKTIRQCQDNILRDELQFKREFLRQAAKHLARLDQALKEAVPHIIYVRLKSISTELVNKKLIIMQNKHKNKLDYLRAKYFAYVPERQTQLDPVKNLSDYILSEDEHDALVNGLNHVYAPEKFNQPQFVCDMEYFYSRLLNFKTPYRHYESKPAHLNISHKLTPTELNTASEIRQAANSFQKAAQTELKHFGKVNRKTFTALRSLARNKSIVISRPDKGRGVVIMDRADYLRKMNVILSDRSSFKMIDNDPTLENETNLINMLLLFKKEGFINAEEFNLARPTGSRPARLYGLPKIHKSDKPDYPLRPVMSATKTVGYGLGKMLKNRLHQLRDSPYTIKNTFDFVSKIKNSNHADKKMVSFDVTSLFTNVPLAFTINIILDKLYPTCLFVCQNNSRSQLCEKCRKRNDFAALLRVATSETHFIFDGKMYVQHNGVAMGAPLAPIIADIFMSHLEESLMDRLRQSGVCEWHRYVDDTFVLLEPSTVVQDVLNVLNSFHPDIKFTHEDEKDQRLSFLDVEVIRTTESVKSEIQQISLTRNVFQTTVFRKSSFTGLMLKWNSFVPIQYKKGSVTSLIQRAINVCSTYSLLSDEFEKIRQLSLKNGYPLSFIHTQIGIGLSRYLKRSKQITSTPILGCEKKKLYVEIPYNGQSTDSFKKKLTQISGKTRPDLDVRFYTKPPPSVQTYFNLKDPIPKHLQADIVYSVNCKDCGDTYVGKTIRQPIRRLKEHGAPKSIFQNPTPHQDQPTLQYPTTHTSSTTIGPIKRRLRARHAPYPNPATIRRSQRIQAQNNMPTASNLTTTSVTTISTDDQKRKSSIEHHQNQTGHEMNWENFNILCHESHKYKLLLKESLIIKAYNTALNKTTHSVPLIIYPEGLPPNQLRKP